MEITGLIIFAVIGAWAGWRTGTVIRGGGTVAIPYSIAVFGAATGGLFFWLLSRNLGGFIGSMVVAVLGGVLLLYLMGFFKKAETR